MDTGIAKALARAKAAQPKTPDKDSLKPKRIPFKQLPLWPKADRAAPSTVLRSSLFRVTKHKIGSFKNQLVGRWGEYSIRYTGLELTQPDLDVWLQTLDLCRENLGTRITFTKRGFLKAIGRKGGGSSDMDWLKGSLRKLAANVVSVESESNGMSYNGPLIFEFEVSENNIFSVVINPKIAGWFDDGYTRLDWGKRLNLKGNLTKWLHGYICSHEATRAKPSKIGIEKLQELCGSELKTLKDFRKMVRASMRQLEKHGIVMSWTLESDVLSFVRPPKRQKLNPVKAP